MARTRPINENATFQDLGVASALCAELGRNGIDRPFPIQTATLPDSLAGRDVLGRGRTGSGKTLAFALPMVDRLARSSSRRQSLRPRGLILAPTRELAAQIDAVVSPLAAQVGLNTITVFGGVGARPQIVALKRGVDIVIACPGRLEDHLNTGAVKLDAVEITVLDEADHMADLGFLPGVKRLLDRTPSNGQRMLFSATLDNGVDILVKRYMHDPVTHAVDPVEQTNAQIDHHVLHITDAARVGVVAELISRSEKTVIFTRTKSRAKQLTKRLVASGVAAVEMHGNLSQGARTRNLAAFQGDEAVAMVATDIAARGIHVDDVGLVVHADPPVEHKAYVHRSGRTARAGSDGVVVTLMTDSQQSEVKTLTRKAGVKPTVTRVGSHDDLAVLGLGDPIDRPAPVIRATPAPAPSNRSAGAGDRSGAGRRPGGAAEDRAPGQGRRRRRTGPGTGGGGGPQGAGPAGAGRARRQRRNPAGRANG